MGNDYDFEEYTVPDWIRQLDRYFGRNTEPVHIGRPVKKINQELLITLHNDGWSNRKIARELGFARRTVDMHINRLKNKGLIE